jgi:uncharacterized phage protein (TIGR02220 family)
MAKDKKSFVAYSDWGDIFDELEDVEAGRLVKHLFDYVRDKNPIAQDKLTKMMFIQIQQSLKRDLVKYDKYIDKQSVNGKKGGRPKKNPTLSEKTQPFIEKPKKADSVNVSVSVNDNEIINNQSKIDFDMLLTLLNKQSKKQFRVINSTTQAKFKARLKDGYTKDDIKNTIINAFKDEFHKECNYKHLTPDYFSRSATIDRFSQIATKEVKTTFSFFNK